MFESSFLKVYICCVSFFRADNLVFSQFGAKEKQTEGESIANNTRNILWLLDTALHCYTAQQ